MLPTVEENRGYDFEDPENAEKWRGLFINSFRKVCERVQYVNDQNIGPLYSVERHDISIIFLNICNKTPEFTNVLYLFIVVWDIFFIFIIDFESFSLLCSTGPSSSDIVIISYMTVLILRFTCKLRSGTKTIWINDGFWINTSVSVFKIMPMLQFSFKLCTYFLPIKYIYIYI